MNPLSAQHVISNFNDELRYLSFIEDLICGCSIKDVLVCAVRSNEQAFVSFILHRYPTFSTDPTLCATAAEAGHLKCLVLLREQFNCTWTTRAASSAAKNGHLHTLRYAIYHGCPLKVDVTCSLAIIGGHAGCFRYVYEFYKQHRRASTERTMAGSESALNISSYSGTRAVSSRTAPDGSSRQIQTNSEMQQVYTGSEWRLLTAYAAAEGRLECLRFLISHGSYMDAFTTAAAAAGGHLDCIKCLRLDEPPYHHALDGLANNGIITAYRYSGDQSLSDDSTVLTGVSLDMATVLSNRNSLQPTQCPWDNSLCETAAVNGHVHVLQYAHEQGCPWDQRTTQLAAAHGHLDCLAYAHEQGCPWDQRTTQLAAAHGHLDCLAYAHEQGCPWDAFTPIKAASSGQLSCLKYAFEQGCPWDAFTPIKAASSGQLSCLKYAFE